MRQFWARRASRSSSGSMGISIGAHGSDAKAGRDAAGAAEDVEQRVVLEPREHELDHLPERFLDVAGVSAEEADQRGVGQGGEQEADDEDDRERAGPDDAGGDDRGRLPELPELADELRLGGGGGTPRFVGFGFGAGPPRCVGSPGGPT